MLRILFSLCSDVKLTGLQKNLWLISISASCWTVWLARNDKVFDKTLTTLDTMLYHSKMRSLMWARVVHEDIQFMEGYWWCWLVNCSSLRSTTNKIVYHWEPPPSGWMKFNVASVALEDKASCGGVLRDDKGVACVLFYGSIVTRGSKMVEIIAIKTALELFIGLGCHVEIPLVIEFNLCVALE
ncbi:hypothetical protein Godav_000113 [Gossypium davidsonii]|uniref:RNase H type-1 domain-containing protein n=2 Tax=Gossypium TaxID=3633 RepID=A0A7J8TC48_GOSDV|nr:hypothetical protein [Gossypium davidsonii]